MKKVILLSLLTIFLSGCATLQPPIKTVNEDLKKYTYCYIMPTGGSVSGSTGVYGDQYNVYGGITKTTNPTDVISGFLMKHNYTILPEIKSEFADKTLIVSYGHVGTRQLFLAYTQIILIQFRDAKTHELVASCEAEGCGDTEADDIYQAIMRALQAIFN